MIKVFEKNWLVHKIILKVRWNFSNYFTFIGRVFIKIGLWYDLIGYGIGRNTHHRSERFLHRAFQMH